MNIATVENLPAQSNRAVSNSCRIAQGVIWGRLGSCRSFRLVRRCAFGPGSASLPPRPIRIAKREKANDPLLFSPDAQPRESRVDARRDRLGLSGGPG